MVGTIEDKVQQGMYWNDQDYAQASNAHNLFEEREHELHNNLCLNFDKVASHNDSFQQFEFVRDCNRLERAPVMASFQNTENAENEALQEVKWRTWQIATFNECKWTKTAGTICLFVTITEYVLYRSIRNSVRGLRNSSRKWWRNVGTAFSPGYFRH